MPDPQQQANEGLQKLKQVYRDVFESPRGQDLMAIWQTRFNRPSYVQGDTHGTAYNEGARGVYLSVLAMLRRDDA